MCLFWINSEKEEGNTVILKSKFFDLAVTEGSKGRVHAISPQPQAGLAQCAMCTNFLVSSYWMTENLVTAIMFAPLEVEWFSPNPPLSALSLTP